MRQPNDTKTMELFAPEVCTRAPKARPDREAARRLRMEQEAARNEAKRWVVVFNPGTVDEEVWPRRFSFYSEALRFGGAGGERFDVMYRTDDGSLTTEF